MTSSSCSLCLCWMQGVEEKRRELRDVEEQVHAVEQRRAGEEQARVDAVAATQSKVRSQLCGTCLQCGPGLRTREGMLRPWGTTGLQL